MDFDLLLDEATPRETTVWLCLNGKLRAEYEAVKARIEERAANADTGDDLPEGDERLATRTRKAEPDPEQPRLDELEEKMRQHTIPFKVVALGRQEWEDLFSKHPPRRDKDGKRDPRDGLGVNSSTFFPALVRQSIAEPEMTADRWTKLYNKLSDAQFERLWLAAWELNRSEEDVPFLPSGSASTPT
ncbi:hypothetical protein QQG74_09605 [Micromonospora sp. FIMYZ51]|uniref:hypothetical protein n=1 Tax=Micromonospora sp. FIMYZ51 TaxID=3051832 RepID=UPI00311F7BDE